MAMAERIKQNLSGMVWPALILIAAAAVVAAQYFGMIDLTKISLSDFWPSSPEFDKFAQDLPSIALSFLFGAAGAFVKLSMSASPATGAERTRRLTAGGVVGIIVFFLLKSQVIPQIMYDNLPAQDLEVSYYGLALLSVFAGMYATEFANWATRR